MTARADFSAEEWELFMRAPFSVAYAVITASPSGLLGTLQELAVIGAMLDDTKERGASELLGAIVADLEQQTNRPEETRPEAEASAETRAAALATCRAVAGLLTARATVAEHAEYNGWLLALGWRVARASREGGFLGRGGARISAEESAVLEQIGAALGIAADD